jgi:hypothetical protein
MGLLHRLWPWLDHSPEDTTHAALAYSNEMLRQTKAQGTRVDRLAEQAWRSMGGR